MLKRYSFLDYDIAVCLKLDPASDTFLIKSSDWVHHESLIGSRDVKVADGLLRLDSYRFLPDTLVEYIAFRLIKSVFKGLI